MQKIKDGYKLTTGKKIYPNKGILGISECDERFRIYEGYDGFWTTEEDAFYKDEIELTNVELKEIALYTAELWRAMANSL